MMRRRTHWVALLAFGAALLAAGCGEDDSKDKGTVIGQSTVEIDTKMETVYVNEAAIADFIADVYQGALTRLGKSVDVVFVNAGSVCGSMRVDASGYPIGGLYPAGSITDVQVKDWLPYPNSTTVGVLSGAALKSVLERGVSSLPADLKNEQGGWLLQVAGLKYTVKCDGTPQRLSGEGCSYDTEFSPCEIQEPGSRVVKIQVGNDVVYDATGATLVDNLGSLSVTFAANSFTATAGDGHLAFLGATSVETIQNEQLDLASEVINYIQLHTPISPAIDGRITIQGTCGTASVLPL